MDDDCKYEPTPFILFCFILFFILFFETEGQHAMPMNEVHPS